MAGHTQLRQAGECICHECICPSQGAAALVWGQEQSLTLGHIGWQLLPVELLHAQRRRIHPPVTGDPG